MDSPSQPKFSWADYVVLGVVLAVSAVIGIFYAIRGRRKRTTNEFMVASRQMGFFPVALSLLASLFTGIYIQGMVSEVYFRGAMAPFGAIIPILVDGYISGKIFLPTFYKLRLKSVYQYLEMRFNKIVRNCCLFIGYLYMILHAGIATFAACLVLTTVSDMSFFVSVIVLSGVCTFYTALTLIGLIGITSGPVMGVFILGFMFPRCNSKGALVGFFSGSAIGLWIFIGSLIFQKPPADLPLSTDGCPVELVINGTTNSSDMYMTTSVDGLVTGTIEANGNLLLNTQSVFMNGSFGNTSEITGGFNTTAITPDDEYVFVLYRITRWWYPTITMCTVILVGLLTSLITGFNDFKKMDDILFVDWYSVFCWCRKNNQMEYELENEPAENEPAEDETENERKTWIVETEAEESMTSEPEEQQLPLVASPSNSSMTTKV